jgi:hypothetical protein
MTVVDTVAWPQVENALHDWIVQSAGIAGSDVRFQVPRDEGPSKGAPAKALITLLGIVTLQQTSRQTQPRVVRQVYTVIADGPGEIGIDFYAARSLTPQRISIAAGIGDPPATSAAALLVELTANLPAGYTASAEGSDGVSVEGSTSDPLFAATTVNSSLLTVATPSPRFPYLLRQEHRANWRVSFRDDGVSGSGTAAARMSKAMIYRRAMLDQRMLRLGFRAAGTLQSQPNVPGDRGESQAVLDVSFIGYMTGATAATAMRAAGLTLTAA